MVERYKELIDRAKPAKFTTPYDYKGIVFNFTSENIVCVTYKQHYGGNNHLIVDVKVDNEDGEKMIQEINLNTEHLMAEFERQFPEHLISVPDFYELHAMPF